MQKTKAKNKAVVAYVPVLHDGYKKFFDKHSDIKSLYLIGSDVSADFKALTKDLRALKPETVRQAIIGWNIFDNIVVASKKNLIDLAKSHTDIVLPNDEIMREISNNYFTKNKVVFDDVFLRWDKHKSTEETAVEIDQIISDKDSDQKIIALLKEEANKSSDWWRRVGAAIVHDDEIVLISHNRHVPSEHMPYQDGDPRCDFSKGVNLELSTAIHAEAGLIAEAAMKGISLKGTSMYVTTFPCPPCAKLIAYSGISKLYYSGGYGVLDGERILKSKGVKIIFVNIDK